MASWHPEGCLQNPVEGVDTSIQSLLYKCFVSAKPAINLFSSFQFLK